MSHKRALIYTTGQCSKETENKIQRFQSSGNIYVMKTLAKTSSQPGTTRKIIQQSKQCHDLCIQNKILKREHNE
jgi:hypothetical protein